MAEKNIRSLTSNLTQVDGNLSRYNTYDQIRFSLDRKGAITETFQNILDYKWQFYDHYVQPGAHATKTYILPAREHTRVGNGPPWGPYREWFSVDYAPVLSKQGGMNGGRGRSELLQNILDFYDENPSEARFSVRLAGADASKFGSFSIDGVNRGAGGDFSYAEFQKLRFTISDTAQYKQHAHIVVSAYNTVAGTGVRIASDTMLYPVAIRNTPPEITFKEDQSKVAGTLLSVSSFVAGTDKDVADLPNLTYPFTRSVFTPEQTAPLPTPRVPAERGSFILDGKATDRLSFTAEEVSRLQFKFGPTAGTEYLTVRPTDGLDLGHPVGIKLTSINTAPVLYKTQEQVSTAGPGESLFLKNFFAAKDDKDGPHGLVYCITDTTNSVGSGVLKLGSVGGLDIAQPQGRPVGDGMLTFEQVQRLKFTPGTNSNIVDEIEIAAYDGIAWSAPIKLQFKSEPLPSRP